MQFNYKIKVNKLYILLIFLQILQSFDYIKTENLTQQDITSNTFRCRSKTTNWLRMKKRTPRSGVENVPPILTIDSFNPTAITLNSEFNISGTITDNIRSKYVVLQTKNQIFASRLRSRPNRPVKFNCSFMVTSLDQNLNISIQAIDAKRNLSEIKNINLNLDVPKPSGGIKQKLLTYHLGNSLTDTVGYDNNGVLAKMAISAGHTYDFKRSTIPGAPIDWLWDHSTEAFGESNILNGFKKFAPINHLTIQPFDRSVADDTKYGGLFYNEALKSNPDIQLWVYQQWTVRNRGSAWDGDIDTKLANAEAIATRIDATYGGKKILVIPGGLALRNLKNAVDSGKISGMNNFFGEVFEDDIHLSDSGAYLIASVFYSCFLRENPNNMVVFNSTLTSEQAKLIRQIAWDTVSDYDFSGIK
jgi:hypothetical protein